jgi:hypothetical protein
MVVVVKQQQERMPFVEFVVVDYLLLINQVVGSMVSSNNVPLPSQAIRDVLMTKFDI